MGFQNQAAPLWTLNAAFSIASLSGSEQPRSVRRRQPRFDERGGTDSLPCVSLKRVRDEEGQCRADFKSSRRVGTGAPTCEGRAA